MHAGPFLLGSGVLALCPHLRPSPGEHSDSQIKQFHNGVTNVAAAAVVMGPNGPLLPRCQVFVVGWNGCVVCCACDECVAPCAVLVWPLYPAPAVGQMCCTLEPCLLRRPEKHNTSCSPTKTPPDTQMQMPASKEHTHARQPACHSSASLTHAQQRHDKTQIAVSQSKVAEAAHTALSLIAVLLLTLLLTGRLLQPVNDGLHRLAHRSSSIRRHAQHLRQ